MEPTLDENQIQQEIFYKQVLAFVNKKDHASCTEMMKEFHISYTQAVHLMDSLESRDIVDEAGAGGKPTAGPRPLLKGKKKCAKPVPSVSPSLNLIDSPPIAPQDVPPTVKTVGKKKSLPLVSTTTAPTRRVKRR